MFGKIRYHGLCFCLSSICVPVVVVLIVIYISGCLFNPLNGMKESRWMQGRQWFQALVVQSLRTPWQDAVCFMTNLLYEFSDASGHVVDLEKLKAIASKGVSPVTKQQAHKWLKEGLHLQLENGHTSQWCDALLGGPPLFMDVALEVCDVVEKDQWQLNNHYTIVPRILEKPVSLHPSLPGVMVWQDCVFGSYKAKAGYKWLL
ncbi:hypothetical protein VNO78_05328 [Psophocarpus tetragonolobus]|uniref:Uncharacterized protein n=1 Tax=Psophocarpus tetragonolobus TaxID=3891 RepID=A0AAN9SZD0_PSOTE